MNMTTAPTVTRLPDAAPEPGKPQQWQQYLKNADGQWVMQCHYGVCTEPVVLANAERDARILRREVAIRFRPAAA